jgi:flagellar biosynthesis/type III secretory pathway protein FliH
VVVVRMKIFTNKQFEQLLDEFSRKITEANKEGFETGYEKGVREGFKTGLHEGLTTNKEGVVFNSAGLYCFKDNESTKYINDFDRKHTRKGEMTNE